MTIFAEPVAATTFSFLRGSSQPADMVIRAHELGMAGIGIADRNTVAGVVRAYRAWKDLDDPAFRLLTGARLVFADGTPDIVAYPATRKGWGRLTRMLTCGNRRAEKGDCILRLRHLLAYAGPDMALIAMAGDEALLTSLRKRTPHVWLAATMPRGGGDARELARRMALSEATGVPLIATSDALFAKADCRPLHDVMACIREGLRMQTAGRALAPHAERHLKAPAEMARLFAACPQAIAATGDLLACISFTLDELSYLYPDEPVPPGWEAQAWLEHLVREGGRKKFPHGLEPEYEAQLTEEFRLIHLKNYAHYFLTVHDIVAHARSLSPPILCQGRGSAANSLVCYFLGVTPIDPIKAQLLFSRFLSEARDEPPDIDVDFEHERREEVMQYIYARYGRRRAGVVATVIRYRQRSAIREVGKALGLSEDVTQRLSGTIWGSHGGDMPEARLHEAGFDPHNPQVARLRDLVDAIMEMPRHLSQHVGGFVLTQDRLDEMVPIHKAVMPDRTFIEWDKDDIDTLKMMKVDVLALGMLTAIRKSFDLMRLHALADLDLASVPRECAQTYTMLQKADSIGTFQVESRAQMAMLPRMKPKELYDLVIQVAIVRPGPIQGGMVHPYLRRRTGEEAVDYPGPGAALRPLLERTLGIPLFQEQAMSIAIVGAGYSAPEADRLRRDMAAFRHNGKMERHQQAFTQGMVRNGYTRDFAERCFKQIQGFGDYGFPESHAQAFAWLAYVSAWLKCHHPAVFCCALLNSQPMGFYGPAQLVGDARAHGVAVRPIDVNASDWDNTLESANILRLGLRQIDGFREDWAKAMTAARPFTSLEDLARRAALPARAMALLADADALASLGLGQRQAGWDVRRIAPRQLSLFAAMEAPELTAEADPALPPMPLGAKIAQDYQTHRLSLKGHPMQILRGAFASEGVLTCAQVNAAKDGARVSVAGAVLVRQRPGKGNAVFITIEDETGVVNALMWTRTFQQQRGAVMAARLMVIEGQVQVSKEQVVHLMAARVHDRSAMLARLEDAGEDRREPPPLRASHPRDVRILPRSRDFH
ncbi:MAG: error-prone DNA polymerase [Sphingomonadales bacterium]|nr:error-prone DNA polymerase [Sphingomonadales bacterium]MDE2171605.1 error-prone DNA polymerase [Sphingomonadales bacterium]